MLAAPGRYMQIQSVEVGEAILFHVALTVPPAGTVVGLTVKLKLPVTVKLLLVASSVKPLFVNSLNAYIPGAKLFGNTNAHDPAVLEAPALFEQLT